MLLPGWGSQDPDPGFFPEGFSRFFFLAVPNHSSCWIFFWTHHDFFMFFSTQVGRVKVPWQLCIWVDYFHHLHRLKKTFFAAWDSQQPTNEQRFIDFIRFIVRMSGDGIRVDAKGMCTDVPINPSVSMGHLARKIMSHCPALTGTIYSN